MMAWLIGGIVTLFLGLIAKRLAEYGKEQPPTAADCVARMRAINEAYTSEKAGPAYRPAPPGLDYYGEYRHWTTHDHPDVTAAKMRGEFRKEFERGYLGQWEKRNRPWLDPAGHEDVVEGKWRE